MLVAVMLAAALLGAFEAGRRWERGHVRRGALKVRAVRHVDTWELTNSPYGRSGPVDDHRPE
jgi:hypothetical protein